MYACRRIYPQKPNLRLHDFKTIRTWESALCYWNFSTMSFNIQTCQFWFSSWFWCVKFWWNRCWKLIMAKAWTNAPKTSFFTWKKRSLYWTIRAGWSKNVLYIWKTIPGYNKRGFYKSWQNSDGFSRPGNFKI